MYGYITSLWYTVAIQASILRASISRHHSIGLRAVTLSTVALGVFLVVEERTAVGSIVLLASVVAGWLTGLWVIPLRADAYSRKLSHIMREWLIDLQRVESQEYKRPLDRVEAICIPLCRCIMRIQRLRPPSIWETDHSSLLEGLKEYRAALLGYRGGTNSNDIDAVRGAMEEIAGTREALDNVSQEFSAKLEIMWRDPRRRVDESP
jgi:hypothetical protein